MAGWTRRAALAGGGAAALLAGCGNGIGSDGAQRIDARVDAVRDALYADEPGVRDLAAKARGVLWMPLLTEASFGFGGGYGRGALRINDITVDYYSATRATFGLQIGGQQYSHALFFMTEDALSQFRRSPGWAVGADVRYATPQNPKTPFNLSQNFSRDKSAAKFRVAQTAEIFTLQAQLLRGA